MSVTHDNTITFQFIENIELHGGSKKKRKLKMGKKHSINKEFIIRKNEKKDEGML